MPQDAYDDAEWGPPVESNTFTFRNIGDTITGVLVAMEAPPFWPSLDSLERSIKGRALFHKMQEHWEERPEVYVYRPWLYTIQREGAEGRKVSFYGSPDLDGKMSAVSIGQLVKITYISTLDTGKPSEKKVFEVRIAKG